MNELTVFDYKILLVLYKTLKTGHYTIYSSFKQLKTISFWSAKNSLSTLRVKKWVTSFMNDPLPNLVWKLSPKTVFSRFEMAVRRKTNKTEPRNPPTMVKRGEDERMALAICMPLKVNTDNTMETTKEALSLSKAISDQFLNNLLSFCYFKFFNANLDSQMTCNETGDFSWIRHLWIDSDNNNWMRCSNCCWCCCKCVDFFERKMLYRRPSLYAVFYLRFRIYAIRK